MKPLFVLIAVFILMIVITRVAQGRVNLRQSARIALSAMLLFTAMGHFMYPEGMSSMLPSFIPYKYHMVLFTGVLEILGAIGLMIPKTRKLTAWLLILFFILVLPANIHAAMQHLDYQSNRFDGPGPAYLWFRVPLQILFILWAYWVRK